MRHKRYIIIYLFLFFFFLYTRVYFSILYIHYMDFKKLQKAILDFRDARDWKQFHNPKDLATGISIEAAELQEKFLWKSQIDSYEIWKNDPEVVQEFADIFIFMSLIAHECEIDIERAVLDKINHNGKKYTVEKSKGKSDKYNKL